MKGSYLSFQQKCNKKYLYIYSPNTQILLGEKTIRRVKEELKILGVFGLFCQSFIPSDKVKENLDHVSYSLYVTWYHNSEIHIYPFLPAKKRLAKYYNRDHLYYYASEPLYYHVSDSCTILPVAGTLG